MKNQSRFLGNLFIALLIACGHASASSLVSSARIGISLGARMLVGDFKINKGKISDKDKLTKLKDYLSSQAVRDAIYRKFYNQDPGGNYLDPAVPGDNGISSTPVNPAQFRDIESTAGGQFVTVFDYYCPPYAIYTAGAPAGQLDQYITGTMNGLFAVPQPGTNQECVARSLAEYVNWAQGAARFGENSAFIGARGDLFDIALRNFKSTFELSDDDTVSRIFMPKDAKYNYTLSDGKMLDLNMHFTLMWNLTKDFGVGVWGKLGWTNMEHAFKGGMEGYKLSHSMYGSLGMAIGLGEWVNLRIGLGLSRTTLSFKPTTEISELYDEIIDGKNGLKNLRIAAKLHSTAVTRMNGNNYSTPPSAVATSLPDLGQTMCDKFDTMPGKPVEQSSDAMNLDVVMEVVFRIPVSDVVALTMHGGVNLPTSKVGYSNIGLDKSSLDVTLPAQMNFGVGLEYILM